MEISSYKWEEPKNQTHEHFLLKNVARIYLVEKGCRYVGTEIYVYGHYGGSKKGLTDCVGVDKSQEISYGIEAKVSVSDFKSGYSARCNYNYVICPSGMIDKSDVPDYVGLIYVDVDNVMFVTNAKEQRLKGVILVKKAKYYVDDIYFDYEDGVKTEYYNEDMMFAYTQRLVESINRSNLNELLYHTNYVPFGKITKGRRRWR